MMNELNQYKYEKDTEVEQKQADINNEYYMKHMENETAKANEKARVGAA